MLSALHLHAKHAALATIIRAATVALNGYNVGFKNQQTGVTEMLVTARIAMLFILMLGVCGNLSAQSAPAKAPPQTSQQGSSQKQEIDPAKKADILKMLKLTGASEMGRQALNQMIGLQKQQNPDVPQKFWDEFMLEVDMNELVERTIPSYDKHFTHADIKEMIKFFESPIGKKMVAIQPLVMRDSALEGQKWGMNLASRMAQKLKDKGFTPKP